MVFVLGINGSPHTKGTTSKILNRYMNAVKKSGAKTQIINLTEKKINMCRGCYSVNPKNCKYPCIQKDDMAEIYPLLEKADAIVLASPVYWFNMSGLMKNFIDRLCSTAMGDKRGGYVLQNKAGVYIAVSAECEGGRINCSQAMASAMNHLGLYTVPFGLIFYPGKEKIHEKGRTYYEDWVSDDIPVSAKSLVGLCKYLNKNKLKWSKL